MVKKTHGETIHYVFQGTEPIYTKNVTTGKVKSYVYAGSKLISRVDGVIGDTTAKKFWYHTDQVGSVKAVTNQAGAVVWNADYLPFGTQYMKNKFDPDFEEDDLGFTGKGFDSDTGLYYFNARWYDTELGRFISEDPIADPNNPNLYSYCANNPLTNTDLTGLYISYDGSEQVGPPERSDSNNSNPPKGGPTPSPEANPASPGADAGTAPTSTPNPNPTTYYTYYENGQIASQTIYNPDGTISSQTTFNENGSVKSVSIYEYSNITNKNHDVIGKRTVVVTDEHGKDEYGDTYTHTKNQTDNYNNGNVESKTSIHKESNAYTADYTENSRTRRNIFGLWTTSTTSSLNISIANNDYGQLFAEKLTKARNSKEVSVSYLFTWIPYVSKIQDALSLMNTSESFMKGDVISLKGTIVKAQKPTGENDISGYFNYSWNRKSSLSPTGYRNMEAIYNCDQVNNYYFTLSWMRQSIN